jgi:hypothetical protein
MCSSARRIGSSKKPKRRCNASRPERHVRSAHRRHSALGCQPRPATLPAHERLSFAWASPHGPVTAVFVMSPRRAVTNIGSHPATKAGCWVPRAQSNARRHISARSVREIFCD